MSGFVPVFGSTKVLILTDKFYVIRIMEILLGGGRKEKWGMRENTYSKKWKVWKGKETV